MIGSLRNTTEISTTFVNQLYFNKIFIFFPFLYYLPPWSIPRDWIYFPVLYTTYPF